MPSIADLRAEDPPRLGGYDLRGRLGEGGQGVVYLAADASGGLVAVKWLRPHLAGDSVAAERFAREAAVATRVAPFCTARVLATGVHEHRPFIVSEYVEGPSLQQVVMSEGPRTAATLHRLAIGTVTALAAIHQAGIVHRDFSPNNVLLANEGPRVIDFGISKALDATTTITSAPIGTPAYMAPEQVLGHPVGPPADMFSWASIMVFAATGNGPFAAESVPAVINRVMHSEPDLSALDGSLRDVVAECLAKDPARRPTAEQVIMRLLHNPDMRAAAPQGVFNQGAFNQGAFNQGAFNQGAPSRGAFQQGAPIQGAFQQAYNQAPDPGQAPPGAGYSPGSPQFQAPPPHGAQGSGPNAGHAAPPYGSGPQAGAPYGGQGPYGGQYRQGTGPTSPPQQPWGAPPRKSGRGFLIAGIAAAVALVATIVVGVVAIRNMATDDKTTTASTSTATVSPQQTPTKEKQSATPEPKKIATSGLTSSKLPDSDITIYEHPSDAVRLTTYTLWNTKLKSWIYYARDSLTGSFRKYPDHWESMLSPDGRYLVKRGKKFTTDGFDSVLITDKVSDETFEVKTSKEPLSAYISAWSHDSSKILLNVGNPAKNGWQSTGFAIVDVEARTAKVASLREGALRDIHYGFDNDDKGVVALAYDSKQQTVRFFDTDGTRLRRIPNVGSGLAGFLFSPTGERFLTNCPGLSKGDHCIYDTQSGDEVKRFESPCEGGSTWYDNEHLVCWVRPEAGGDRQQIQVIDFTGRKVRILADVPTNGENTEVYYTFRTRN